MMPVMLYPFSRLTQLLLFIYQYMETVLVKLLPSTLLTYQPATLIGGAMEIRMGIIIWQLRALKPYQGRVFPTVFLELEPVRKLVL